MYSYRFEKRVKYYGHTSNTCPSITNLDHLGNFKFLVKNQKSTFNKNFKQKLVIGIIILKNLNVSLKEVLLTLMWQLIQVNWLLIFKDANQFY
jgi:hypothetical protein